MKKISILAGVIVGVMSMTVFCCATAQQSSYAVRTAYQEQDINVYHHYDGDGNSEASDEQVKMMRDRRLEQLVTDPNDYTLDSDDATPQKTKKHHGVKRQQLRLAKVRSGNFGDYKFIGEGIFELRFFFGGGCRVYFGKDEVTATLVILLCGGNKSTQSKDIKKAKVYWREYNERKNQKN